MDFRALEISWSCEWQDPRYLTKPAMILGHLLGHEGPGSIHAYLKNKGWISYLSAGIHGGGRGFSFFKVTMVLTKDGMDHHKEVLLTLYRYLEYLKASSLPTYIHEEDKLIAESRFRFAEKRSADKYVSSLSEKLSGPYPRHLVLCAEQLVWEWDEPAVRSLLNAFTVEQSRVMLMAKEGLPEGAWVEEKWYGTEYWTESISAALPAKKPVKLHTTELSTVWHKKDDQFWIPKARIIVRLMNPICNATPRHSLLSRMFVDLVKDTLTEFTYDAELAGMKYSIVCDGASIMVVSEGYNDKLSVLMEHVLEKVKSIVITQDRVTVIAEQLQQEIENFYLTQPYTLSNYYADHFLRETSWTPKQKLESLRIGGRIESILGSRPITAAEKSLPRSLTLPSGSKYVWEDVVPNKDELNSSLTYYVEIGDLMDAPLRATLLLFAQMIREPAFNQLRTKEQLGYVVSSSAWFLHGSIGWHITVQSERKPVYLENRVEGFLDLFRETLKTMSEAEFERQRDAFAMKRLERLKNMGEEASRFWTHIESGYEDFLRRETDAKNIRLITKQDIETFFNNYVHHNSSTRRKLSIHLTSQKKAPAKFSVAASEALLDVLKQEGVPVDEDQYRQLSAAEPPLDTVVQFWTKHLENHASSSSILPRIPDISAQYPATSFTEELTLPESIVRINDIAMFKAHLTVSKAPTPDEAIPLKRPFTIESATNVNHICVFMLGTVPFPPGYAATVHFHWPGKGFQLLGILRGGYTPAQLQSHSTLSSAAAIGEPAANDVTAILGIAVEPVQTVEAQINNNSMVQTAQSTGQLVKPASQGLADPAILAEKIVKHMFTYLSSFVSDPGSLSPDTVVPLNIIRRCLTKCPDKCIGECPTGEATELGVGTRLTRQLQQLQLQPRLEDRQAP
ncbi:insulin-degrading enzyme [Rhizoctonia solani AG-1 IA]|uniref:Insulin-degrading enzyme n=1 Tax=Thanatephorus cucumeris (strain AG1-IA) TaxID=983506 RepID=L8X8J3_THACA|nr:insulin-degrading enzyme [Rhizoctonia solani AG-1 IA]